MDQVEWTGAWLDDPASTAWLQTLSYVYDPSGRRIGKYYDGLPALTYIYDGTQCIAEYDGYNHLRRKYVYGPGVDQPICLIEATNTYAGTYYYHFDGSGNVVALTDADANAVEVYDYDVYGRVGAIDANHPHPNRLMFTGREFDKETGLYYYRARYYKPEIGRFLQADSVGYSAGMNLYRYCKNNPWNMTDPFGLDPCEPCDPCAGDPCCSCDDPCDSGGCPDDSSGGGGVFPGIPGMIQIGVTSVMPCVSTLAHPEAPAAAALLGSDPVTKVAGGVATTGWFCRMWRALFCPKPAPSPPKKPPDKCREDDATHEHFFKSEGKKLKVLHHHMYRQNFNPKTGQYQINTEDDDAYLGPCPPDTDRMPSNR